MPEGARNQGTMTKTLRVHFLPQLTSREELRGATVVVIDVLRASTTIAQALSAGAREVLPFGEVEHLRQVATEYDRESIVLGGEREGLKIDLFDLGNSPAEYTADSVGGKSVLFTTTNGTRAMQQCGDAFRVLIGSLVNLTAVCDEVFDVLNLHLLCAGTAGQVTREDVLAAGAIAYNLSRRKGANRRYDDGALVAQAAWRGVVAGAVGQGIPIGERVAEELRATQGGRNLLEIGQGSDLESAGAVDSLPVVPELDVAGCRIYLP
jgi:2-phosphosulfolactate phosphatase